MKLESCTLVLSWASVHLESQALLVNIKLRYATSLMHKFC